MYIDDSDRGLLDTAQRTLSSNFPYIPLNDSDAVNILALRHFIGVHSIRTGPGTSLIPRMSLLLCRYVEEYPDRAREYLVLPSNKLLADRPVIKNLLPAYARRVSSTGGYGSWTFQRFEAVLYAALGTGQPRGAGICVVNTDDLRGLVREYTEQERQVLSPDAAPAEAPAVSSVRSRLAVENAEMMTESERRRSAQESRGKCFGCESPKPRRVPCRVCGYTPSSYNGRS